MPDGTRNFEGGQTTVLVDVLGGDPGDFTQNADHLYLGDASFRNLQAWRTFVRENQVTLAHSDVQFVLFGRAESIERATREALGEVLPDWLEIVNVSEQTPMGNKKPKLGTSMAQMFQWAKNHGADLAYTAGSSAAQVMGARILPGPEEIKQRDLGNPIISKEVIPGVYFGDNGALANPSLDDYQAMYRALRSQHLEAPASRVMILPSDRFTETEIKQAITTQNAGVAFMPFEPLTEIGLGREKPTEVLADGFIGNLHLKLMELLYKDKSTWVNLWRRANRNAIVNRLYSLQSDDTAEGLVWELPADLPAGPIGVLCNGTEDTKGTQELKTLMNRLETEDRGRFRLVEPSDLLKQPNLPILATPASQKLVQAFLDQSIAKTMTSRPDKALAVWQARKTAVDVAEVINLATLTRVIAAHGAAPLESTIGNFRYLLGEALKMQKAKAEKTALV